jgi:hypothetical protein
MADNTKTWLGRIFATIASWFSSASGAVHDLTVLADNLANAIKNLEASTVGTFIETTVEMLIPASTGLINAFKLWLPVIVTDLNWAVAEEGKTPEQILADAIAYLNKIKVTNPNAYAGQLNTLNALIQKWFSDNQGLGLTIQAALTAAQVVHDPSLTSLTIAPALKPVEVQVAPPVAETPPENVVEEVTEGVIG